MTKDEVINTAITAGMQPKQVAFVATCLIMSSRTYKMKQKELANVPYACSILLGLIKDGQIAISWEGAKKTFTFIEEMSVDVHDKVQFLLSLIELARHEGTGLAVFLALINKADEWKLLKSALLRELIEQFQHEVANFTIADAVLKDVTTVFEASGRWPFDASSINVN